MAKILGEALGVVGELKPPSLIAVLLDLFLLERHQRLGSAKETKGSIPIFGLLQQQNSKENSFCTIGF
jgi:hypothetical protein